MNKNYEFIEYTETPGEKHLGIVTVRLWNRIILRFKLVPSKDGNGFYITTSSYKVPDYLGNPCYAEAFMLEMRSENEALMNFIRSNAKQFMSQSSPEIKKTNTSSVWENQPSIDLNDEAPF